MPLYLWMKKLTITHVFTPNVMDWVREATGKEKAVPSSLSGGMSVRAALVLG